MAGDRPFLVTTCSSDYISDNRDPVNRREDQSPDHKVWEWDVDPYTRYPIVPEEDLDEIVGEIEAADAIVGQNLKFDVSMLTSLFSDKGRCLLWPWDKTHDTLIAGHLLASNHRHDLTSMAMEYLFINISSYEDELKAAVRKARQVASSDPSLPCFRKMGSASAQTWLPKTLAQIYHYEDNHPWRRVLRDYAGTDSWVTLQLWQVMWSLISSRGLEKIYKHRLQLVPISLDLERKGVTLNIDRAKETIADYEGESRHFASLCTSIAEKRGVTLTLPKSGNNKSLEDFCTGELCLPAVKLTASGKPSLDKNTLEYLENSLPKDSDQHRFVSALREKRRRDTAVTYLRSYIDACIPIDEEGIWATLHGSANPTGTDTLRWSFSQPNSANISKQEGFNLRKVFGPGPDEEWWSPDAENIELRIPAYESGEKDLIHIFDHPTSPPYYGSYHLAIFDLLYPHEFKEHGVKCKELYASTLYQWVKNGNFACIYGAQEGTADRTYRVEGAFRKITSRFPNIAELNERMKKFAGRTGRVETIPDRSVDPSRGYPLLCSRLANGHVLPTIPLNYHVSGTAMQWTNSSMIKCTAKLLEWRGEHLREVVVQEGNTSHLVPYGEELLPPFYGYITLQVHDELVFCFPKSLQHPSVDHEREKVGDKDYEPTSNLWRIRVLQRLMESCGDDIGIPTPVSVEYNEYCWADGIKFPTIR